uniref:Peptidase S1 domain-containing protein n=1 Tax=Erpetoichthys calabaricus TaxID=27687 RepID=A0A8C4T2Y3_ERPCA
ITFRFVFSFTCELYVLTGVSGHRIVGGKEVVPHSRPYMVYLEGQTDNAETFLCGGSLIRENVIMTAAHCDAR